MLRDAFRDTFPSVKGKRDRTHDVKGDDSPILSLSKSWLLCLEFAFGIFIKLNRITPGQVNSQHDTSGKLRCCENTRSFIAHNSGEAIHNICTSGDSMVNLWDLCCLLWGFFCYFWDLCHFQMDFLIRILICSFS